MADYNILKGSTFSMPVRWEDDYICYRPITAISNTAPARITAAGHEVTEGWRVAIVSVRGMTEINASGYPLKDKDYHVATVIDVDTLEFNKVNAADFSDYLGGGYVQYNTPVDLAGYTARMSIKDKVGGVLLLSLTTENGGIAIDLTAKTITLQIGAMDTAGLTWRKGVFDLEMVSSGATPVVTKIIGSTTITVSEEITT